MTSCIMARLGRQVATGTALRISELKMDPHEVRMETRPRVSMVIRIDNRRVLVWCGQVEAEIGDEIRSGAKAEQEKEVRGAR